MNSVAGVIAVNFRFLIDHFKYTADNAIRGIYAQMNWNVYNSINRLLFIIKSTRGCTCNN